MITPAQFCLTRSYRIKVTFIDKEGDEHDFEVSQGDNLLDIAQANDLEMEGILNSQPSSALQALMQTQAHAEAPARAQHAT